MYVWVDALTNYITATGFPDAGQPRASFWPADAHVIGKDITRFHAIYWPAFLMSARLAVAEADRRAWLPVQPRRENVEVGRQCRAPADLVRDYGVDQLRYFFLREVPFGQDGNYSHEAIVNRINADLANDLGNLAQRSLSMIAKNCGGAGCRTAARCTDADTRFWRLPMRILARSAVPSTMPTPSTRRSMRSGRWWPTPTAISPGRSPGR